MGINGSVQQGEDALDVTLNTGGVNDRPVCNLCPFDETILDGSDASEAGEVAVGPTIGMSVSRLQHVLVSPFFIDHHDYAQGHAPGVFPCLEQARTRNDVNAFEQEVDALSSSPFNGGRHARFNGQAGFVPIQYRLTATSS